MPSHPLTCASQWYDALSELHHALGDVDMRASVWAARAVHAETRRALALEAYGSWLQATRGCGAHVAAAHTWLRRARGCDAHVAAART